MHLNQNWPPVITALGVYPCFRNATGADQGCCRDLLGHTDFLFKTHIARPTVRNILTMFALVHGELCAY
jgi:hypothetical protein